MQQRRGDESALPLCRPFLDSLPVDGVAVTVMNVSGAHICLEFTDDTALRLDEIQRDLGEGPQWEAFATGDIVEIADVEADPMSRWPTFGNEARGLKGRAICAVPLRMGAATVGVAQLHRRTPMALSATQKRSALAIGSAIAGPAVQQVLRAFELADDSTQPEAAGFHREIHQATGMILVQLDTTATIAYSRLQAYAFSHGRSVRSVAHDVVTRALVFTDED